MFWDRSDKLELLGLSRLQQPQPFSLSHIFKTCIDAPHTQQAHRQSQDGTGHSIGTLGIVAAYRKSASALAATYKSRR